MKEFLKTAFRKCGFRCTRSRDAQVARHKTIFAKGSYFSFELRNEFDQALINFNNADTGESIEDVHGRGGFLFLCLPRDVALRSGWRGWLQSLLCRP